MKPLELAQTYMNIVFGNRDFEELRTICTKNLNFKGPLYEFYSIDDYISSLLEDPPKDFQYKIIRSYEDKSSACLIYQFSKPGINTPMMQLFEINKGKIHNILLLFDTKVFI